MKNEFPEPRGLNDVAEFHETFNLPIEKKPTIPAKDRCALRVNLLQEELNELKDAIADNDLIMPPKTTWFEPKLRSGLVVHSLE